MCVLCAILTLSHPPLTRSLCVSCCDSGWRFFLCSLRAHRLFSFGRSTSFGQGTSFKLHSTFEFKMLIVSVRRNMHTYIPVYTCIHMYMSKERQLVIYTAPDNSSSIYCTLKGLSKWKMYTFEQPMYIYVCTYIMCMLSVVCLFSILRPLGCEAGNYLLNMKRVWTKRSAVLLCYLPN